MPKSKIWRHPDAGETPYSSYTFEQFNAARRGELFRTGDKLDEVTFVSGSRHLGWESRRKLTARTVATPMRMLAMPSLPAPLLGTRRVWLLRSRAGVYYAQYTLIEPYDKCEWMEYAEWRRGRDVLSLVRELASPWAARILSVAARHDVGCAKAREQIRRPRKSNTRATRSR
ncbi:MAG: hypothetical protein GC159_19565 [Phycisphaera sp.]|nr:hypothetical protein [Phycisphaera sp.]